MLVVLLGGFHYVRGDHTRTPLGLKVGERIEPYLERRKNILGRHAGPLVQINHVLLQRLDASVPESGGAIGGKLVHGAVLARVIKALGNHC